MEENKKDFTVNPIKLFSDFRDIFAMFFAAFRRKIPFPWRSFIWGVIFLVYLIVPIDLVPEAFLSFLGLGDDVLLFVYVINKMRPDLENYRAFRDSFKELGK